MISLTYYKIHCLYPPILFGLQLDSFKFFFKSISICNTFFIFQRNNPCVITENINNTYIKKQSPLLNLLITCISAISTPQILTIKDKCTFPLLIFLIIGLCNCSANSLLETISFLTASPDIDKTLINHQKQTSLISIIFWNFSNIKCFIMRYFIRSCSSSEIFKISISHVMLKTSFL